MEEIANGANKGNGVDEGLPVASILLEIGVHIPNGAGNMRLNKPWSILLSLPPPHVHLLSLLLLLQTHYGSCCQCLPVDEIFSEGVHISEAKNMQPEIGGQLFDGHISELGPIEINK